MSAAETDCLYDIVLEAMGYDGGKKEKILGVRSYGTWSAHDV